MRRHSRVLRTAARPITVRALGSPAYNTSTSARLGHRGHDPTGCESNTFQVASRSSGDRKRGVKPGVGGGRQFVPSGMAVGYPSRPTGQEDVGRMVQPGFRDSARTDVAVSCTHRCRGPRPAPSPIKRFPQLAPRAGRIVSPRTHAIDPPTAAECRLPLHARPPHLCSSRRMPTRRR